MESFQKPTADDVLWQFWNHPGELEIIIEHRKRGMENEAMARWKEYDLPILESGLRLIRHKKNAAKREAIGLVLGALLLFIQIYLIALSDYGDPKEAMTVTFATLALAVPVLIFRSYFYDDSNPWVQAAHLKDRVNKRIVLLIYTVTLVLSLINLTVGAH